MFVVSCSICQKQLFRKHAASFSSSRLDRWTNAHRYWLLESETCLKLVNSERHWNSIAYFRYRGSIEYRNILERISLSSLQFQVSHNTIWNEGTITMETADLLCLAHMWEIWTVGNYNKSTSSALPLASARLRELWIPFQNNLLDGALCENFFYFHIFGFFFWFSNMILLYTLMLPLSQLQTQQVMKSRIKSHVV